MDFVQIHCEILLHFSNRVLASHVSGIVLSKSEEGE